MTETPEKQQQRRIKLRNPEFFDFFAVRKFCVTAVSACRLGAACNVNAVNTENTVFYRGAAADGNQKLPSFFMMSDAINSGVILYFSLISDILP